jgi:hypothetical protein
VSEKEESKKKGGTRRLIFFFFVTYHIHIWNDLGTEKARSDIIQGDSTYDYGQTVITLRAVEGI